MKLEMEEIEKLEEAARKYSGVDKIRLAFWEGSEWHRNNNYILEKVKDLRDEYINKKDRVIDLLPDDHLKIYLKNLVTLITELNSIINEN